VQLVVALAIACSFRYTSKYASAATIETGEEAGKVGLSLEVTHHTVAELIGDVRFLRHVIRAPGEKLVTDYAGVFGFFTDAAVIDMWGLTNATIAVRGNGDGIQPMYGKTCVECYREFNPDYFHIVTPLIRKPDTFQTQAQVIAEVFQGAALDQLLDYVRILTNQPPGERRPAVPQQRPDFAVKEAHCRNIRMISQIAGKSDHFQLRRIRPGNQRIVHHVMTYIDTLGFAAQKDGKDGKPGDPKDGKGGDPKAGKPGDPKEGKPSDGKGGDPSRWPKLPLPNKWTFEGITGLAVDKDDVIWVLNRPGDYDNDPIFRRPEVTENYASLSPPTALCCLKPEGILAFDEVEGNRAETLGHFADFAESLFATAAKATACLTTVRLPL
jgi:hypothetical protein